MLRTYLLFLLFFMFATSSNAKLVAKQEAMHDVELTDDCLSGLESTVCRDAFIREKDPAKIKKLIAATEKQCLYGKEDSGGENLCFHLGLFLLSKKEIEHADRFMKKDCRKNLNSISCLALSGYYIENGAIEKAVDIAKESCALGNGEVMNLLAETPEEKESSPTDCQLVAQKLLLPGYYMKQAKEALYASGFPGLADPNSPNR